MTNVGGSRPERHIRRIPLPFLATLIVIGMVVAAATLLGPASTPVQTQVGIMTLTVNELSEETLWGNQYVNQTFTVSLATNSYTNTRSAVVPLLVLENVTCSDVATFGFIVGIATSGAGPYTPINTGEVGCIDATTVSNGPGAYGTGSAFFPSAATYGKVIAAGHTGDTWYFQLLLSSHWNGGTAPDLFGVYFTFVAQAMGT